MTLWCETVDDIDNKDARSLEEEGKTKEELAGKLFSELMDDLFIVGAGAVEIVSAVQKWEKCCDGSTCKDLAIAGFAFAILAVVFSVALGILEVIISRKTFKRIAQADGSFAYYKVKEEPTHLKTTAKYLKVLKAFFTFLTLLLLLFSGCLKSTCEQNQFKEKFACFPDANVCECDCMAINCTNEARSIYKEGL